MHRQADHAVESVGEAVGQLASEPARPSNQRSPLSDHERRMDPEHALDAAFEANHSSGLSVSRKRLALDGDEHRLDVHEHRSEGHLARGTAVGQSAGDSVSNSTRACDEAFRPDRHSARPKDDSVGEALVDVVCQSARVVPDAV